MSYSTLRRYTPLRAKKPWQRKPAAKKLGKGRKTKEWDTQRRSLKTAFQRVGITVCEMRGENCTVNTMLTWAHARKRRLLKPGELQVCALLCQNCHQSAESASHAAMHAIIMGIIRERDVQPVEIPASAWEF